MSARDEILASVRRALAEALRRSAKHARDRVLHVTSVSQPSNCLVEYHSWT